MFGKMGELKKMYDKYRSLQKVLKNLVIRGKEGSYTNADGETVEGSIIVDITGEMKLREFSINDLTLLDPTKKNELEKLVTKCFQKAQTKAQEVVGEKTKDELGFDPSNMASMLGGGGMPGLGG